MMQRGWAKALCGYCPLLNTLIAFVGGACTSSTSPGDAGIGEGLFALACVVGYFFVTSLVFVVYVAVARKTYFQFDRRVQKAVAVGGAVFSVLTVFAIGLLLSISAIPFILKKLGL
jgi:hypothetical protein